MPTTSLLPRAASCALVLLLAVGCASAKDGAPPDSSGTRAAAATVANRPDTIGTRADSGRIQGSATAPVWMVIVSDFQCPYCKIWHDSTYDAIRRDYVNTGKVRLAYVNLPLPSHKGAWASAEAAMCAGLQGRFWEMHDAIFDTQAEWSRIDSAHASFFDSLAVRAGLDMTRQRTCVTQRQTRPIVQADLDRSLLAGINSTPVFIIGGTRIEGAYPIATFRKALDAALASAGTGAKPPAP